MRHQPSSVPTAEGPLFLFCFSLILPPLSLVLLFYCFVQQSTITDPFQSTN